MSQEAAITFGLIIGGILLAFWRDYKSRTSNAVTMASDNAVRVTAIRRELDAVKRQFHEYQLEARYQAGKNETEIAHLKALIAKQDKEIEELKRQRDDLGRMLMAARVRIKALEDERDDTHRKLALAIAASKQVSQQKARASS